MSYRNPQIIRDTSGQAYGQAVANIGQSLAKGIMTAGARREQQRKEAEAERKRTQQIGYGIQSKAYEQRNKVYSEMIKKEPGLAEQFKQQTEILLMGGEGVEMGAIEARTLLATSDNLDIKRKQELQDIINRYDVFQNGLQGNAGKILSETQIYNDISPADFDTKYRWAGSNQYEKRASQFAAAAFSNQEIPGVRYEKKLYTPTSDGEQVVGIKFFVDPNDPSMKNKFDFDDKKMYPRNQNGEVEIEWKKDLNKWDEGLLEEIVEVPDSVELFKEAGITNDNGDFNENQYLNISGTSEKIKGIPEYSQVKTDRDVNVAGWANNTELQDLILAKADGLQGMRDDELSAFMEVKMNIGKFNITEFRKLSSPEQIAEIQKELNEEYIIQKTKNLDKRSAKEGEAGAVVDPLNPVKLDRRGEPILDSNNKEIPNFVIYSEGTKPKTVSTASKDTPFNAEESAIKIYNEFARDPLGAYNRYKQGPEEKATLVEGSIITIPQFDKDGNELEPLRYNMDNKQERGIFFQELLEESKLAGGDDKGRAIRLVYPSLVDIMSDKYMKEKTKKSKKKLPIIKK